MSRESVFFFGVWATELRGVIGREGKGNRRRSTEWASHARCLCARGQKVKTAFHHCSLGILWMV
jgi:hypothetical protein